MREIKVKQIAVCHNIPKNIDTLLALDEEGRLWLGRTDTSEQEEWIWRKVNLPMVNP